MRKKNKIREIMSIVVFVVGAMVACYVGGWTMFLSPIINVCKSIDSNTLTALDVGIAVLKCIFALPVAWFMCYCSAIFATVIDCPDGRGI